MRKNRGGKGNPIRNANYHVTSFNPDLKSSKLKSRKRNIVELSKRLNVEEIIGERIYQVFVKKKFPDYRTEQNKSL